jgi:uncharacterized protein (DUF983 family)
MPLTGAIPEGPSFFCPHCGALYAVTYSRLFSSDSNVARCVVCGQIMDKWDSTKVPTLQAMMCPHADRGGHAQASAAPRAASSWTARSDRPVASAVTLVNGRRPFRLR